MNENISSSRVEALKLKFLFSKLINQNLKDKDKKFIEEIFY